VVVAELVEAAVDDVVEVVDAFDEVVLEEVVDVVVDVVVDFAVVEEVVVVVVGVELVVVEVVLVVEGTVVEVVLVVRLVDPPGFVESVVLVVVEEVAIALIDDVVDEDAVEARLELGEVEDGERTTYAATPPTATIITMIAAMRIGAIPPFCRCI
jgi:hypothetical protein